MNNTLKLVGMGMLGVIIGFLAFLFFSPNTPTGGSTNFGGDLVVDTFTSNNDTTVSGGTLNVTTSNTATSTVIGGCFQFYATSTATASKFQASTTPGIMYSAYGTCPNL